MHMVERL